MKDLALTKVVEANEVEIPEVMIADEIDAMLNQMDQQLRASGLDLNGYLGFMGKTISEFIDEVRPDAEKSVKTKLIMTGIVEAEKIEVSEEEVEEEIKVMAIQYQMTADKVKELLGEDMLQYLVKDLKTKKAIEMIYENAVIK